ncbi:hypothetical protein NQ317_013602, partial [Molorchus minor]
QDKLVLPAAYNQLLLYPADMLTADNFNRNFTRRWIYRPLADAASAGRADKAGPAEHRYSNVCSVAGRRGYHRQPTGLQAVQCGLDGVNPKVPHRFPEKSPNLNYPIQVENTSAKKTIGEDFKTQSKSYYGKRFPHGRSQLRKLLTTSHMTGIILLTLNFLNR